MEKKIILIVGPTASGKTELSLNLSQLISSEIISADSRQIYKFLDVGTAKPTKEELKITPHHFIDIKFPDEHYSSGIFGRDARIVIDEIFARGKVPLVVGGSGLYIRALLDSFFDEPDIDIQSRLTLREQLKKKETEKLYNKLKEIDVKYAESLKPTDRNRIIRAIEIHQVTGIKMSDYFSKNRNPINHDFVTFGILWERKKLYKRIEKRTDEMLKNGLIDEVKTLKKIGYDKNLNSLQTVGYKEVFDYLDEKVNYETMCYEIKKNSRNYAKRQMTWFRADKRIKWINIDENSDFEDLTKMVLSEI
jgi:tRNA dimethylallyltransferase